MREFASNTRLVIYEKWKGTFFINKACDLFSVHHFSVQEYSEAFI